MTTIKYESSLRIGQRTLGYEIRYVQVTILYGMMILKLMYTNLKTIILQII